jgi:hypothetical protein
VIPPAAIATVEHAVEVEAKVLSETEIAALGIAVKRLEEASDGGKPVPEVAGEVVAEVPLLYLKDLVDGGVTAFQEIVRQVAATRPDDPDSVLLTPRGEAWLRELFSELRRRMEASAGS